MAFDKCNTRNEAELREAFNALVDELNTRGVADISFDNTTPANGEQLTYNSTTGKYEPNTA